MKQILVMLISSIICGHCNGVFFITTFAAINESGTITTSCFVSLFGKIKSIYAVGLTRIILFISAVHLTKLSEDINRTLEKINSREKYVNQSLEHTLLSFRQLQVSVSRRYRRRRD